jgi:Ca2+-binding RTX toxin-like protein
MTTFTGNNAIDALFHSSWATQTKTPISLTYSFLTVAPVGTYWMDSVGFAAMTAGQREGVKAAMATWSAVANITYTEVASGGDLLLGTNDQGTASAGYATYPASGRTVYLFTSNIDPNNFNLVDGGYGKNVLIHELGHTLGLKHPGDYAHEDDSKDEGPFLPTATDNRDYTVMSYNQGSGVVYHGKYGITPMLYDIQVAQLLYGANMTYHTGADTYRFTGDTVPQCIWDAGGVDTLDFSACAGATVIDLNAGSFSSTAPGYHNISIAYNVTIERAIAGNGGSTIHGNDAGNVIIGGIRNDYVYLGKGSDTVTGGGGGDIVIFENDVENYTLSGNSATLTVKGQGTDVLNNIPTLYFKDFIVRATDYVWIGAGGDGADVFKGGSGAELFSGGAGVDTVSYSRERANFTVWSANSAFKVRDDSGSGGIDVTAGVERLKFSDGSGVALDIDGAAGQTYRLYQAAFNRTPDQGGFSFWLDKMDDGLGLASMAQFFLNSAENVATYGTLTDAQFVGQVYTNVLHRQPDAGGLDFYLKGLAAGLTRAAVLADFSESPENQAAVIGSITNGINYTVF